MTKYFKLNGFEIRVSLDSILGFGISYDFEYKTFAVILFNLTLCIERI